MCVRKHGACDQVCENVLCVSERTCVCLLSERVCVPRVCEEGERRSEEVGTARVTKCVRTSCVSVSERVCVY